MMSRDTTKIVSQKISCTFKRNYKNIVISLILIAAMFTTGAFAYRISQQDKTNAFTIGDVRAFVEETDFKSSSAKNIWSGKTVSKNPAISIEGDNPAFIYAMVTVPKADGLTIYDKESKMQEIKNDYQLFAYELNPEWTPVLDSDGNPMQQIKDDDLNNYYLYTYNTELAANGTTTPIFNSVTFANYIGVQSYCKCIASGPINTAFSNIEYENTSEGDFTKWGNKLSINIDIYAIQSQLVQTASDNNSSTESSSQKAWDVYVAQNGWSWPREPADNHLTYLSTKNKPISYYIYGNATSEFEVNSASAIGSNAEFVGWKAQNGQLYQNGDTITAEDLYIKNKYGEIININPTLKEVVKYNDPNIGTDKVMLIPKAGSTTVVDRGGQTVDDYKDGVSEWCVYGLRTRLRETALLSNYIDVQGDGRIEVILNPAFGTYTGTGTVINVYDRKGTTDDTSDDVLVETFRIVIFGDINGDSMINSTDTSMAKDEADGVTTWSNKESESYNFARVVASDFDGDGMITEIDKYVNTNISAEYAIGLLNIDQTTGTIYK